MISGNLHRPTSLLLCLFVILLIPSNDARRLDIRSPRVFTPKPTDYNRLARYCHIDNHSEWLKQQQEFILWFNLAKMLALPVHEDPHFKRELERYRLQYECLRIVERMPILLGPG